MNEGSTVMSFKFVLFGFFWHISPYESQLKNVEPSVDTNGHINGAESSLKKKNTYIEEGCQAGLSGG